MNAIVFSLYGDSEKYCIGAIKNMYLAAHFYPAWKCHFFIDESVPGEVLNKLKELGAVIHVRKIDGMVGYFWRFMANDLPGVERYIVRDTDSRINGRERTAVEEWVKSGKQFHIMRDHPHHNTEIMGGMWGAVNGSINNMGGLLSLWNGPRHGYGSDQEFLKKIIWPMIKESALQHDDYGFFPGTTQFSTKLSYENMRFVGEVFDEKDEPRAYDWELLLNYIEK